MSPRRPKQLTINQIARKTYEIVASLTIWTAVPISLIIWLFFAIMGSFAFSFVICMIGLTRWIKGEFNHHGKENQENN